MSIEYDVDHERKLVSVKARGILTDEDIFDYQRTVWSRKDVAGYNEMADLSEVENIILPSADRIRQLATLSAGMDAPSLSNKLSIFAPNDFVFGLGRMFEAYREMNTQSRKRVGVFRTLEEALAFLESKD